MKFYPDHKIPNSNLLTSQQVYLTLFSGLLLMCMLVLSNRALKGQDIIFNPLLSSDGNDFDFVTGIAQDNNGIMWFSTKLGLFRYDGHTMSSFKNNPGNPNSLVSNFTECIHADSNGEIWIGTLGLGLDVFDPKTGIFTHFRHDPDDPLSLANDTVTEIMRDQKGILWIGSHGGLDQYHPETNSFIHFRHDTSDQQSLSNNQVRALYEDSKGRLWVGTGSPYADNGGGLEAGGLNRLDIVSGTFTRYLHDPNNENSLINNKISAIYEDDKGNLLVGTRDNGLHRMNPEEGSFERLVFDPAHPEKLSGPEILPTTLDYEHITFITQDSRGKYWYGTTESGLYYFDPVLGKSVRFHQSDDPVSGFSDRGAWSVLSSRDGILWIGCTGGDIYRINPSQKKIPFYETPNAVQRVYELKNGDLWIATENKILKKTSTNGLEKQYILDVTPDNDENDYIQIIKEDRQGNIWIGGSQGLFRWNEEKQKFIQFRNDPEDGNSLNNDMVLSIYEDSKANFWVGTIQGINLMDRNKGTFNSFYLNEADTGFIGRNLVTSIMEDKNAMLWFGLWNGVGIYRLDPELKSKKNYLSGSSIVCLYKDTDDVLWAGTNYGLFKYIAETDVFQRYLDPGTMDGFSFIDGLIEDNQKYLWLSTNGEIIRINPQRTETNTLGMTYGIDKENFVWNSINKGKDGKIYIGADQGYYAFDPAETINDSLAPEIAFTGFRLADQLIIPGETSLLEEPLMNAKEIKLGFDQNVFSFDYAVIDYANPQENKLIYILENYDKYWLQPNSERRAYYFNVPPGKYTFRVKAANSYGIWTEKKINITILPPWWKTWWAYGMYAVVFLVLILAFDRIQRRRIRQMERQKTYKRELAQAKEIEKAYLELKTTQQQLVHAEKMASLGELTAGIAHEIQNPLNFVNNFSEVNSELITELAEELDQGDIQEARAIAKNIGQNEEKIMHHGKRADAIVKNMLQHSRGSGEEKQPTDINALADEYLRLSYHGLRAKDSSFNADFDTDFDLNLPKVLVVPQEIGRVLLNLINNAFFAVYDQGLKKNGDYKPFVKITTKNLDNEIELRVYDNGGGIPAHVKDKIFQPFFTTKPAGQGTGLGLSLSYDIIKAHGGELTVLSDAGEGTTFIIHLSKHNL